MFQSMLVRLQKMSLLAPEQLRSISHWGVRAVWLAYAIFLFVMTHSPVPQSVSSVTSSWDKPIHFTAYFVLAVLTAAVCIQQPPFRVSLKLLLPTLVLFAAFDEILQGPFGRHPDFIDWAYDCLGIGVGLVSAQAVIWGLNQSERLAALVHWYQNQPAQSAGEANGFAQ